MASANLSSDTKISIKDFVSKVMKPATHSSESSIIKNYDPHDPIRIKHSYGHLQGGEIIEAVKRYPGELNVSVAQQKINDIAESQARIKARSLDIEMDTRTGAQPKNKGKKKKAEFEQMRSELKAELKDKTKKEYEAQNKRKFESAEVAEQNIKDLPID